MIHVPGDYDSARSAGGSPFQELPVGGHVCRILNAKLDKAKKSGADMLIVAFDVAEGSEFDGYYAKRFERSKGFNQDAKWPGIFRTGIMTRDGKTNSFFKGLIVAVEKSNAGYSFKAVNFDEATLKGKLVGFNFGIEEYQGNDGSIRESVRPFWAVSVNSVRDGIEPPRRKTYQPQNNPQTEFVEVHEKLPWDD